MKLRFFKNTKGKKIYTMKEKIPDSDNQETKQAHYKFIKIRDAPKSNYKKIRKD